MTIEECHFAEACAENFVAVARGIEEKITTVGTDSAQNMTAAATFLPSEHMPCVAHILQRYITVNVGDSGFVSENCWALQAGSTASNPGAAVGAIDPGRANTLEFNTRNGHTSKPQPSSN